MKSGLSARFAALCGLSLLAWAPAYGQHEGHTMPGMAMPPATTPAPSPSRPLDVTPRPDRQAMPGMQMPATGTQSRADPNTPRPLENTSAPTSMPVSDNMVSYQMLLDQIEYTRTRHGGSGFAWDVKGWVGRDYDRLWIRSEGERQGGRTEDGRLELLYGKPIAAFWDVQAGVRHDLGESSGRNWLAFGVQGVAPYWYDVEATAYVADGGRTAFRFKSEYQWLLTQKTFLAPELEANFYGKSDPSRGIGSGLSDASFGLRLRHELRREFAPYVGVNWTSLFGQTADLARAAGEPVTRRQLVVGVRSWF